MSCEVKKWPEFKNDEGVLVPSQLFIDLLEVLGNLPQTMYYWSLVRNPEFLNAHGNWMVKDDTGLKLDENGEFSIDNFKIELKNPSRPKPHVIKKSHIVENDKVFKEIQSALNGNKYIPAIQNSENKRWVVNTFFRFKDKTKPYYPFSTGNINSDLKIVREINSLFDQKVVTISSENGLIVFTAEANDAVFLIETPEFLSQKTIVEEESGIDSEVLDPLDGVWGMQMSDDEIANQTEEKPDKITGFEAIVNEHKELVKILKRRLSRNSRTMGDEAIRNELLYAQIARKRKAIKELEAKQSVNNYIIVLKGELNTIEIDLKNVLAKINKEASPEDTLVRITELRELSHQIKGFQNIFEHLPSDDLETRTELKVIKSDGDILNYDLLNGLQKAFLYYANKTSFSTQFTEEIYEPQVDIDKFSVEGLGLAYNESTLLQITDDIIKIAEHKINDAYADKREEIKKEIKLLEKATGLKGPKLYNLFLEKTKQNVWSGHLVSQISSEYRSERFSMEERAKKEGKWNLFYSYLDDNEYRMTEEMYIAGESKYFSKREHMIQNKKLLDFKKAETAFEDGLKDSELYTDSDGNFISKTSEALFNAELSAWKLINSPFEYWAQRDGRLRYDYRREGSKYVVDPKPKSKNISNKYKSYFQSGNEAQLRFFNFIYKTFEENNEYLPFNRDRQDNYLPEVEQSLAAKLASSSLLGKVGDLADEFKIAISEQLAEEYSDTISIAGKDIRSIPIQGMGNRLTIDEKSQDLSKILLDNTKMALNYHYKTLIEPVANAAVELFDQMKEKTTSTVKGEELSVKKSTGEIKAVENRLSRSKAHLMSTINAALYGVYKNVEGRSGKKIIPKAKRKVYNTLKELLKKKKITKEEFDREVDKIAREITWSASMDTMIKYTYIKALSMPNIISPAVNVIFGLLSNLTYSAAGVHFTDKDITKAMRIMTGVMLGRRAHVVKHLEKIYAFMDKLNVLADVNESNYGTRKSWSEILVILQSKAEYLNQGSVMLAMLFNTKFTDKQGNTVTAFDSFKLDEEGRLIWDDDKMGEQEEVAPDKIIGKHGLNIYRFGNKITGINKYLHGDYFSKLKGKETSLGRMLFLFKTWLPMSVKHRFGKESFDPNLQEIVKGRYRIGNITDTHGEKLSNQDLIMTIVKGILTGKRALNELSDIDKANIARNVRELHLIAVFTAVVFGLTMLIGDDEDRKNARLRILINTLSKARQDMMLYMQPSSMTQVANNLIPLISTINDVTQLTRAAIDTVTGHGIYDSGPWKDHAKLEPTLYKLIPGVNVYPRMKSMSHRIYR